MDMSNQERQRVSRGIAEALRSALFAHNCDFLGTKATPEKVRDATDETVRGLPFGDSGAPWSDATPMSIRALQRHEAVGKITRAVGHVAGRSEVTLLKVLTADGQIEEVERISISFQDSRGATLSTLPIIGCSLIDKIDTSCAATGNVEVLGITVHVSSPSSLNRVLKFLVLDVREAASQCDLINATESERAEAEAKLAEAAENGFSIQDYIKAELVDHLHISGLQQHLQLDRAIDFAILQSLSHGRIGHSSGRLNLLLIGSPATGKKLVGTAARVLNPVTVELSPAKVSLAGLIGTPARAGSRISATRGALVTGSNGVAWMQDAHGLGREFEKIAVVLQELMEDGRIRDSVVGGQPINVATALLIDLNRASQVGSMGKTVEVPILLCRPFISRIDLVLEFSSDTQRSMEIAESMLGDAGSQEAGPLDEQPWVRRLRVLVATLRDRHPNIELDRVAPAMAQAFRSLWEARKAKFADSEKAADIPLRLAMTFKRVVSAYARGSDRSRANESDVDNAVEFLKMKLDYVAASSPSRVPRDNAQSSRQAWVRAHATTPASPEELAVAYTHETGVSVSSKTIRRDLIELRATRTSAGQFVVLPTDAE